MSAEGTDILRYGDKAGEHSGMERGTYDAWAWVIVGFLYQVSLFWMLGLTMLMIFNMEPEYAMALSITIGVLAALWTFWDRWRVIEAFSSRFCSGLSFISMFYVPVIAWIYANYRAIRKFNGT